MTITTDMEKIYKTNPDNGKTSFRHNWYKQKPYAIVFTGRKKLPETFFLPISPSNLNITTHWATNVISTMYGTVEEHSEQRYYDIVISGTTGMAPRYYRPIGYQRLPSDGRVGFPINKPLGGNLGGFFKRTQALINNSLNQAADIFGEDKPKNGVDLDSTGYIAFHNLYKFLLTYKKDTSGESSSALRGSGSHPLTFVNYKDNNEYDIAITGFQLTRDASNPMLYNYNLTMRAYNLRNADSLDSNFDIQDRSEALGLNGIETSLFAKMANKARQAKNAAYSAIAAVKGFGK